MFVTGDTHGKTDWGKIFDAKREGKVGKDEHLIIAGDFGGIWYGTGRDNELLDRYAKLPFNILFIDGNHENFDALNAYPITVWNGGKVHKIRENVIHLMRGQVFTIDSKTIFTMGGGQSIDKAWRLNYEKEKNNSLKRGKRPIKIWWEQEMPTTEEIEEARANLAKAHYTVDYIITHTNSNLFMKNYLGFEKENNVLTHFLDEVFQRVTYEWWHCGHFHMDQDYKEIGVSVLYDRIIKL